MLLVAGSPNRPKLKVLSAFNPDVKNVDLSKTYDNSFATTADNTYHIASSS